MISKAAKEPKVATQMGNQVHASEEARLICEFIWSGAIGMVREVHGGSNRIPTISPRGIPRPKETPPCPAHARLGPLARSFARQTLSGGLSQGPVQGIDRVPSVLLARLVGFWDRLPGPLGCHQFSAVFRALKLGHSTRSRLAHRTVPPARRSPTRPARWRRSPPGTSWRSGWDVLAVAVVRRSRSPGGTAA